MKRLIAILLFSAVLLSCATTGEKMSRLSPGLTKAEVVDIFGSPDGFKKVGDQEVLTYSHRLVTGWAWDRADYHIILQDDKVTEYGAGEIRVKDMNTILLVPLR